MTIDTLSMRQALALWSELEQAYYGDNKYGGDTAEVYAYRLLPNMPVEKLAKSPEMTTYYREMYDQAQAALVMICRHFMQARDCLIVIDGLEPSVWLNDDDDYVFDHRCHVKVIHKVQPRGFDQELWEQSQ